MATKVCALAAMSRADTCPVMSMNGPRPSAVSTAIPSATQSSSTLAHRCVNRAAPHISRGSSRKPNGSDGSASKHATAPSAEQGEVAGTSRTETLTCRGRPITRGRIAGWAPRWVTATHSSGRQSSSPPVIPKVIAVIAPAAALARVIPTSQRRKSLHERSSRALLVEAGEPPEDDQGLDRVRDREPEGEDDAQAGVQAGHEEQPRHKSRERPRLVRREDQHDRDQAGGRPPPGDQGRVGSVVQPVHGQHERRRCKRSEQHAVHA